MSEQTECLFCKIVAGHIPSTRLVDNQFCIAINDINPQAPTHILVIPKSHFDDIAACSDAKLLGDLFQQASKLADENGLQKGFRLIVNTGSESGQTIDHLHIHILGGRPMSWPPG